MRKLLLFVFLLFALINRGFTQGGYPIFVTPTLTPPYSLKLSEYSKFGSQRMVVNIAVNDLNISNLPVKLHIKLETVGVTIETPATINTTPIYLDGGAVTILFGDDLTDYFNINNLIFKGYSKETYRRTGQLPEGFYKMTVEVLHYQTNRLISNSGTATAWITLGKPPVLKLPENNKVMGEFKGMPLTFSWLPCNLGNPVSAGSVKYKFEMWEMRVDGVSPYVVASTVPVFYEETTSNTLLSVYPATMLMEPGMKYAWRVTASDMNGFVPFEQDGHSEIRVFSYKSKCDSVTNFKAEARGRSGLFGWQPKSNHTSYNVELRNPETGWLSASETFDNKVEFQDLEYGSTYEIRTQAVCDNDPSSLSDFTAWHRLEVPDQRTKPDSASCPNCGCDDNIIPKEIENLELNRNLKPGDTLVNRAGTTRFIVKTATQQGDGVYKGIFLFWAELWKVKFVCEYWDLSANTDNVILNMDFKSVYNPQFLLDVDVMTAYLDSLASAITTLTINTTISDTLTVNGSISTVYVNEGDSVIVVTVGENGELTEIVIGTNSDDLGHTLITGEDGEEYVVTGNGEVMGVDEFKNTGGNDRKIEEYKEEKESHLSATTVNFAASPTQKYGFDAYTEQKQALRNGYPALGNGYVPSYKSVASFATDKVVPSSFEKGITFRDEMGIPAVTTGGELTLRGRSDGTVTSLYAYKAVTDTTEEVAGKLEVMSYDQQVKKLYIVPVNNAKLPDVTALQNVLNTVYAQAVTRWEVVRVDSSVSVTFPNGQMTHGGSSAIAVYNSDQNTIISKFKETNNLESNALYLFFVDNVVGKTGDVAGYMPLQRQVGFIYDSPNLFVIAHELGHGAFNLRHTFSPENFIAAEHTTQNLMDYNGGTELWKHQWEFIRDPQSVWFAWAQDESEGEMVREKYSKAVCRTFKNIQCAKTLNVDKIKLFFPTNDFSVKIKDLISEFKWAGSDCSEEEIRFYISNNTYANFHNDYIEDTYSISSIQENLKNKNISIKGNESSLVIAVGNIYGDKADCIFSFIKSMFSIPIPTTNYNNSTPLIDDLQYASLCEFSTLTFQQRKEILLEISGLPTVSDSREKIAIQIISTTDKNKAELFDYLNQNSQIINSLYEKVDDYRKEFINALYNLWASQNSNLNSIVASLILRQKLETSTFTYPYVKVKGNKLSFESKTLFIGGREIVPIGKTIEYGDFEYFEKIAVTFEGGYASNLGGKTITLPAVYIRYLLEEEQASLEKGALNFGVNIGLIFFAYGEVVTAVKMLPQAGNWVSKIANLSIATANLSSVGISSVCNNNTSEFCEAWKEYELYVNLGLISAQSLPYIKKVLLRVKQSRSQVKLSELQNDFLDEVLDGVDDLALGGGKAKLLLKLDGFADLKTWVNSLDDVSDAGLLSKLDGLDNSYLTKLNTDIVHTKYGSEIKSLLKENSDDLTNVWKRLKDDPAYSWELSKTDPQWQKWSQREFFKDITAKGKGFETDVCLRAFKNRSSAKYAELKNKFQVDFGKNLDDYDMYSQVQLKYNGEDYFVADQLFVKYKTDALGRKVVDDFVVIENKLSSTTPLTMPQSNAFNSTSFTVRSQNLPSQFGSNQNITSGTVLKFSGTKQWYKVHDGSNGDVISGISKMQ